MIQFVSFLDSKRVYQGEAPRILAVDAPIARTAFMGVLRTKADVKKADVNRVGGFLTEPPSHTTGHTFYVPRRFPVMFNAA